MLLRMDYTNSHLKYHKFPFLLISVLQFTLTIFSALNFIVLYHGVTGLTLTTKSWSCADSTDWRDSTRKGLWIGSFL